MINILDSSRLSESYQTLSPLILTSPLPIKKCPLKQLMDDIRLLVTKEKNNYTLSFGIRKRFIYYTII